MIVATHRFLIRLYGRGPGNGNLLYFLRMVVAGAVLRFVAVAAELGRTAARRGLQGSMTHIHYWHDPPGSRQHLRFGRGRILQNARDHLFSCVWMSASKSPQFASECVRRFVSARRHRTYVLESSSKEEGKMAKVVRGFVYARYDGIPGNHQSPPVHVPMFASRASQHLQKAGFVL